MNAWRTSSPARSSARFSRRSDPEDFGILSRRLRIFALIALVAGAAGSVAFLLYMGRGQRSALLVFLFTMWVLSPFVLLALGSAVASAWPPIRRTALYGAMLGVSFVSLSVYAIDALLPSHRQAAFVFVVVPPACWVLIALTFATAAVLSPRRQ